MPSPTSEVLRDAPQWHDGRVSGADGVGMYMIIIGILLVAAAVGGFFLMRHTRSQLHTMIGTETLSIPELEELRRASDEVGGRGGFRKIAEVVGAAHPSPEGVLVAEVSKTECVWYRYKVERHYEHVEYRDGKRHRSRRTEKVADFTSTRGYALIDEQGRTIGVDPGGTEPDGREQTVDRFEPHQGEVRFSLFGIDIRADDSTIGFDYKEWLIRPGQRMYILGEVHDKIGPLVIAKPDGGGHFIVSARTEDELRRDRTRKHKLLAIGVVIAFAAGLALTVIGIVR